MPDLRWTEETAELVADAIADANSLTGTIGPAATAVLGALAEAGLLLPPGAETRVEWALRVDEPHPARREKLGDLIKIGEKAAPYGPRAWKGWVPVSRTITTVTGPWREVDDAPP